jgi:hypothetical protein
VSWIIIIKAETVGGGSSFPNCPAKKKKTQKKSALPKK